MKIKTDKFTYAARTFTAEASCLGIPAGQVLPVIDLESHYSGNVVRFKLNRVQRDREGDVQFWDYESEGNPWKIRVFND